MYYPDSPDDSGNFRSVRPTFKDFTQSHRPHTSSIDDPNQDSLRLRQMNQQNPLEKILYGDTNGKKTFSQFRQGRETEEGTVSVEENTVRGPKKRKDTVGRMEKSYRRRQRDKKVQKLSDNSDHWSGLQ